MTFWRKLVWGWLLGLAVAHAAPKEEPTPPPPPMPQTQNVGTFRGRPVEIPLRAIGRAPTQLKFLIRKPPKHGRLGQIQFTSRKTAVVTYYHDEKSAVTYDSFTYAVQGVGTPVSAPATVHIAISEEPPALSVVHALDFGQVWVGQKRTEELVIRNTGGGSLAGRIVVSEPWMILGSPEYRLGRKEEKKVLVQFAPSDAGEFTARLLFSHDPRSSVVLSAGARAPLEFEPEGEVVLDAAPGKTVRAGHLIVRNRTSADRMVDLSLPEQVEGPEEITVPAEGEVSVDLRTKENFSGALEDRVDLQSEGFQHSLPLRVSAVPPLLRFEPAEGLDFGEMALRSPVRRTLTLWNEGGSPARVRLEVPKSALVIPDPNPVVLAPGERRAFEVELELTDAGNYRGGILLGLEGAPGGQNIPLRAEGVAPAAAGSATPQPASPPRGGEGGRPAPAGPAEMTTETFNSLPPVEKIQTQALSRKTVELRWKKPAPNAVTPLLEYRTVERDVSGRPAFRWNKWQGANFREESGEVVALLDNLPPGATWYLRVVSLDETGRRSRPSETLRLVTPRAPSWRWLWWVGAAAGAGLVGYAVVRIRRRQEAEARADAERLAKIHP
jgi:hypothetical protein